jgi:hypothetical protein
MSGWKTFLTYIQAEWDVIMAAPVLIGTLVIVVATVTYITISYLYKEKNEGRQAQLELARDEHDAIKRKLEGENSNDAEKIRKLESDIEILSSRLEEIGPKKLNAKQQEAMKAAVGVFKGSRISIAKDGASPDAASFSAGLVAVFQECGWQVGTPVILGVGTPPPTGVAIKIPDPENRTPAQQAIVNAFDAASIKFDLRSVAPDNTRLEQPVAEIILTTPA